MADTSHQEADDWRGLDHLTDDRLAEFKELVTDFAASVAGGSRVLVREVRDEYHLPCLEIYWAGEDDAGSLEIRLRAPFTDEDGRWISADVTVHGHLYGLGADLLYLVNDFISATGVAAIPLAKEAEQLMSLAQSGRSGTKFEYKRATKIMVKEREAAFVLPVDLPAVRRFMARWGEGDTIPANPWVQVMSVHKARANITAFGAGVQESREWLATRGYTDGPPNVHEEGE